MKVVMYHISDLHIEKEKDIKVRQVYKMIDVLNSIGNFDAVLIIVSGDIAFSGKQEQYNAAFRLFGTIISNIRKRFKKTVCMLAVPGNHDVDLSKDEGHKAIQDKIRSGITIEMITQELSKQRNYLNYAKGIRCIDNKNDLCCFRKYEYEGKVIKVCLINTAIFSTLDEDKTLSENGRRIISRIPLNRVLTESDAPYNKKDNIIAALNNLHIDESIVYENFQCLLKTIK